MSKARLHVQVPVPSYFVCPISLELMLDPVTLSSGQTFDRSSIEKWLEDGHATCPVTRQPIDALEEEPIPNHTLRRMIQTWCEQNQNLGVQRIVTPRQPPSLKDLPSIVDSLLRSSDPADEIQKLATLAAQRHQSHLPIARLAASHLFKLLSSAASAASPSASASASSAAPDLALRLLDLLTSNDLLPDIRRIVFLDSSLDFVHQVLLPLASFSSRGRPDTRLCSIRLLLRLPLTEPMKKKLASMPAFIDGLVEMVKHDDGAAAASAPIRLILELCRGCQRARIAAVDSQVVACLTELLDSHSNLHGDDRHVDGAILSMREAAMEVLEMVCHCAEGRAAMTSSNRVEVVVKHMSGVSERVSYLALHILWLLLKSSPDSSAVKAKAFRQGALVKAVAIAQSAAPPNTRHVARNVSAALLPFISQKPLSLRLF